MSEKIIPRWEWRTFANEFGEAEERIKKHERGNLKFSEEKYILSKGSNENTKFRDDLMDIKSLQEVNQDSLEQWYPTMKDTFPMTKEKIAVLFTDYFKAPVPQFKKEAYTFEAFLEELIKPCDELEVVDVKKERHIYVINMAVVEIAEAQFNGIPMRTICVEHADPDNVMKIVRELGLEGFENINYITAMKKAVGLE
ncbi:conserved hypothetical protein [Alkaliphilus metalliredigens QYMF]|uniref:Uncharacterized protein n=1 Tax=Alkaliphilus metalliredigens (strain QYMF) TaxID=293826 RepID=A6TM96_ALKMQ|nr:hypothetical protein [Alkaliphilus metalliredigens]ABR47314.1 conserved hypothetical protein [Alkaliphilus metalliredigens QYMF]